MWGHPPLILLLPIFVVAIILSKKGLFVMVVAFHFQINASNSYYWCKVNLTQLSALLQEIPPSVCSEAEIPYPFLLSCILLHLKTHPVRSTSSRSALLGRDVPARSWGLLYTLCESSLFQRWQVLARRPLSGFFLCCFCVQTSWSSFLCTPYTM